MKVTYKAFRFESVFSSSFAEVAVKNLMRPETSKANNRIFPFISSSLVKAQGHPGHSSNKTCETKQSIAHIFISRHESLLTLVTTGVGTVSAGLKAGNRTKVIIKQCSETQFRNYLHNLFNEFFSDLFIPIAFVTCIEIMSVIPFNGRRYGLITCRWF